MKINKAELLSALKADLANAEHMQKDWAARREKWLDETMGRPYGNEQKGKSSIVSKDIKKQLEGMLPAITDPFLSTSDIIKANPVTDEDREAARQSEILLNTQFCRKFNRYNFIMKATRVLASEGTVIIQCGWESEEEEVETQVETIAIDENGIEYIELVEATEIVVTKNQPTAVVRRNEDVFIDPTCQDDMDNCQFVIVRYETDLSSLRADGRYKNLDKVARAESGDDVDYDPEDETEFTFQDDPRKKMVMYEYWGNYDVNGDGIAEPVVCVWIGNTIIRLESNPYPDKKPPFIVVPFSKVPFQLFGEALAESIGDNQRVKTAATRGILNSMTASTNGQVGFAKGMLDEKNKKLLQAGKNFEYNDSMNGLWQGTYNSIPNSVLNLLSLQDSEIESQTSFSSNLNSQALGGTATSARGALTAQATRKLDLVRNLAENMIKPLLRKWLAYSNEFLEEEEIIRYTNNEFVQIRRDDLDGRIDIDIGISTAEDNSAKAQELAFMLQTMGQSLPSEITTFLLAEHLRLVKLPDQAKRLEEYKPQPDPMTEQAKQIELERLQLENDRLRADIAAKYASAQEDEADKAEKMAQARLLQAKVRQLDTKSDLQELDFIEKDENVKHINEMEKKEHDKRRAMEELNMQRFLGGPNEQLGVSNAQ